MRYILTPFSSKFMNEIRKLAYEYIFALVAEWYSDKHNISNVTEFNKQGNSLKTYRLSMYPFFFAMANGTSESLFKLLGPFYTEIDGPVAQRLLDIAYNESDTFSFFELSFRTGLKVKIEDIAQNDNTGNNSWEYLKSRILSTSLRLGEMDVPFSNISIKKNDNSFVSLTNSLDKSLDIIKKQSNDFFIDFNTADLRSLSSNYGLELKNRQKIHYDTVTKQKVYYSEEEYA